MGKASRAVSDNPALASASGIDVQKIKSLKIMSILGEVVYTTVINDEKMTIDVSDYSSGVYIVSFITTDAAAENLIMLGMFIVILCLLDNYKKNLSKTFFELLNYL